MARNLTSLFSEMFVSSPVPMMVVRKEDGIVIAANNAFYSATEYSRPEIIDRSILAPNFIDRQSWSAVLAQLQRENGFYKLEITTHSKSGRTCFFLSNWAAMEIDGEKLVVAVMQDITEQKRSERFIQTQRDMALALNAAKNLDETLTICMETALAISGMDCGGVYLVDETNGSLYLAYHRGLPERFVKQTSYFESTAPNTKVVMAGKPVYAHYQTLIKQLGIERDEQLKAIAVIPIQFQNRTVAAFNIASHSLDEMETYSRFALETIAAQIGEAIFRSKKEQEAVRAEEALRERNRQFRAITEASPDAMLVTRISDGLILYANKKAGKLGGMPASALIGIRSPDFYNNPEDRLKLLTVVESESTAEIELPLKRSDGTPFWAQITVQRDSFEGESALYTCIRDITERKRAELSLHEKTEELERFFTSALDLLCVADTNGYFRRLNHEWERVLGYRIEDLEGKRFLDLVHPDDLQATLDAVAELDAQKEVLNFTNRYRCKDGVYRWIEWRSIPNGKLIYAAARDITERRQAEKKLQESAANLEAVLGSTDDIIAAYDAEVRLLAFNKACGDIYRTLFNVELRQGLSTLDFFPEPMREFWIVNNNRALAGESFSIEFELPEPDGRIRSFESRYNPILHNGAVEGFTTYTRDITVRKQMMEGLQNTQKLESLGLLAGGIAHDFNNLLSGIFGYIDLAIECSTDEEVADDLSKALNTIHRARALTGQLLTFAKGGAPIKKLERLSPFVEESTTFALSGSNVSCRFEVPNDLWTCEFDKNQIGQVIDNIVINAQQAMPDGGMIEIAASNLQLAEKEHALLRAGSYVAIRIKDHGIGIPKEILSKIFDPFFTTKAKGHGLGLAICYSIVKRHGGGIDVESDPGKGAMFTVYLPATLEAAAGNAADNVVIHKGSGAILIMDDEFIFRDTLSAMVKSMGYDAHCVEHSQAAIDLFTSERERFAAIILDLTIPGGPGGKEAIRAIRKIDKEIRVFVTSGYADDPVMADPTAYGFNGSICKPFRKKELSAFLERHLKKAAVAI
jgi:PAS domain S-box-containing protein